MSIKYFVELTDENVYMYKSKDGELVEYDIDKDASTLVMSNSTFVRVFA